MKYVASCVWGFLCVCMLIVPAHAQQPQTQEPGVPTQTPQSQTPMNALTVAEPMKPGDMSAANPDPRTGLESCFAYYRFGSVPAVMHTDTLTFVPGATAHFTGEVTNENPYPIDDVTVYGKIYYKKDFEKNSFGPDVVDWVVVADNLTLKAGETVPVSYNWTIPSGIQSGNYQLATFVTSHDRFNLSGLSFTTDVVGNLLNFSVEGGKDTFVRFDTKQTTVNGSSYHAAAYPAKGDVSTAGIPITAVVTNTTAGSIDGSITWKLYSWDAANEQNLISTSETPITIGGGASTTVTYSLTDTTHTVYYLLGEFVPKDATLAHSILSVRYVATGANSVDAPRIASLGASAYPGVGGETRLFACLHSTGDEPVQNVRLELTSQPLNPIDRLLNGDTLGQATWKGTAPGAVSAISIPMTHAATDFSVTAKLYVGDTLIDEVTSYYRCGVLDGKCTSIPWLKILALIAVICISIAILILQKLRRPPENPSGIGGQGETRMPKEGVYEGANPFKKMTLSSLKVGALFLVLGSALSAIVVFGMRAPDCDVDDNCIPSAGGGYGGSQNTTIAGEFRNFDVAPDANVTIISTTPFSEGSARSSDQVNLDYDLTLWYGWNRWLDGNPSYSPPRNDRVSGYVSAVSNPHISIGYDYGVYDTNTGQPISKNDTVANGQQITLKFGAYTSDNIFWFGTGFSMDSPYGEWRAGAAAPPLVGNRVTCDDKDFLNGYTLNYYADKLDYKVYAPFVVNPPTRTLTDTNGSPTIPGLNCGPLSVSTLGEIQADCTVTAMSGTITPTFNFASTTGLFYYRYYDYRDLGEYGGEGCYGNNIPMAATAGAVSEPSYNNNAMVPGTVFPFAAHVVPYPLTVAPSSNNPVGTPTLNCPATANIGADIAVKLTATDPDGDKVQYAVDWPTEADPSNTGTASQNSGWTALVNSGTSQTLTKVGGFSTAGVYKIYGVARDEYNAQSAYAPCTVTVSNSPTVDLIANNSQGPVAITSGGSANLEWSSANVTSCTGTNFSTANATQNATGVTVSPAGTTTYTINCTGPQGPASDSVEVRVVPPGSCTGIFPTHAVAWGPGSEIPGPGVTKTWIYSSTNHFAVKCEYRCALGYKPLWDNCVPDTSNISLEADPTTAFAGGGGTATTSLSWTANNGYSSNQCTVGVSNSSGGQTTPVTGTTTSSGSYERTQALGTQYYKVACLVGRAVTYSNEVSFTVTSGTGLDLSSDMTPTANGTLTQGQSATFNGRVRNTGTTPVTNAFTDNFTYRWGGTGAWTQIGGHISEPTPLAVNATADDTSSSFTLSQSGALQIQHCIDSQGSVSEDDETNNCQITTFTVASAPTYSCTGTTPADATLCTGDDSGLSSDTPRSSVNVCTVATKCEYQCNSGYTAVLNRCISGTISGTPTEVAPGGTSDITWSVGGNTTGLSCEVSGGSDSWSGTSGTQTSSPITAQTLYILSCNGIAIDSVTINLIGAPILTANPRIVSGGGTSVLTYDLKANTTCTLTGGGLNQALLSPTGTITSNAIFGTTKYTITCDGGISTAATVELREEGHET